MHDETVCDVEFSFMIGANYMRFTIRDANAASSVRDYRGNDLIHTTSFSDGSDTVVRQSGI